MDENGSTPETPEMPEVPTTPEGPTDDRPETATPQASAPAPEQDGASEGGERRPAPPHEKKRRLGVILLAVGVGVFILAGAATAVLFVLLRGTGDVLAKDVPADTALYATFYLDPSAGQKLNIESLAGHFPGLQNKDAQQLIDELNSKLLSNWNLSASDVKPWLGTQIGCRRPYPYPPFPHRGTSTSRRGRRPPTRGRPSST